VLLDFATVAQADLSVTEAGARFVTADILTSKELFATQAEQRAPLVRSILNALTASINGVIDEEFFLDTLRRGFSPDEARRQLDRAIDWGRYAELYDYDANTGELILEHREEKTDVPAR
jgi:NitT/TauT family transport system ATP-binding protein